MRSKSAPIINHHAKTITVTVKEKGGGVYVACIGDDTRSKQNSPRNWGHKSYWREKGWDDCPDKRVLWKNVTDAFKNDDRYQKEKDYTVKFQHFTMDERCQELGLNREGEEARNRKHDAEWFEWATAKGYSPHPEETNHSVTDLVGRENIELKKRSLPDDRTQVILPSIPDAESFINRIKSIVDQSERDKEDAVKELLVRLKHPPDRIFFQPGRVDLILKDSSGKSEFVFEVKKSIASASERAKAQRQAVDYANRTGAKIMVITDADRYDIYDRRRGWEFNSMFCGSFQLTKFDAASAPVLDLLRCQN